MDRRTFLTQATVFAALSGVAIRITACSSDDSTMNDGGSGTPDVNGNVSGSGHPHSVTLTGAHIDAGAMVTLTLTDSGHTHALTLTAQEVMDVGNGGTLVKDIDPPVSHPHTVQFN
jgi:hypothetical protein